MPETRDGWKKGRNNNKYSMVLVRTMIVGRTIFTEPERTGKMTRGEGNDPEFDSEDAETDGKMIPSDNA